MELAGKNLWIAPKWEVNDGDTLGMVYDSWVASYAMTYQSGFQGPMWYGPCCGGSCASPPGYGFSTTDEFYRIYWIEAVDILRSKLKYPLGDIENLGAGLWKRSYTNGEIYIYPKSGAPDSLLPATINFGGLRNRLGVRGVDPTPITSLKLPKGRAVCVLKPPKGGDKKQQYSGPTNDGTVKDPYPSNPLLKGLTIWK